MPTRKTGQQAESDAEQFLQNHGLRLESRNYSCRYGEIDLIMTHADTLVFVEVRLRSNARFGGAAATVDLRKQAKLVRSAEHYLQRRRGALPACRFDVVAIDTDNKTNWIKNAFEASN